MFLILKRCFGMIKYFFPTLLLVTLGAGCGSKIEWHAGPT